MMKSLKQTIFLLCLFIQSTNSFNCYLPEKCRLEHVYTNYFDIYEKDTSISETEITCDVNDDRFTFRFKEPTPQLNTSEKCFLNYSSHYNLPSITFKWTSTNEMNILDKRFNITNALRYLNDYFDIEEYYIVNFWDVKGFDVNIFDIGDYNIFMNTVSSTDKIIIFVFTNSRFEFYQNKKKISSCKNFIDTGIDSIFQMNTGTNFKLKNIQYKRNICPLIFKNAQIQSQTLAKIRMNSYDFV